MKDIFFPEERAILHSYFRIPKPDELRNVRYWADDDDEAAEGEAPVAGPILVLNTYRGSGPDFSLNNAVARIAANTSGKSSRPPLSIARRTQAACAVVPF